MPFCSFSFVVQFELARHEIRSGRYVDRKNRARAAYHNFEHKVEGEIIKWAQS